VAFTACVVFFNLGLSGILLRLGYVSTGWAVPVFNNFRSLPCST